MKKIISIFLVVMLAATVLVGCGNSDSANGSGDGPVKLTFWHTWTDQDARSVEFRKMIEDFEAAHPEIELEVEAVPHDGYKTRLKTVAAADEMPDVFITWPAVMTQEFVDGDLIQPIDDLLNKYPEWKDNFLPKSFDDYTVDGSIYSVPSELTPTSIIYYNKALFEEQGLEFPKNWDDFTAAIETFKDNGVIPISLGNKAPWVAQSCIISSLGNRVTGTEWFFDAANGEGAAFTDPEFVSALNHLQELAEIGAFQEGFNTIDSTQQRQLFYQGKAAMFIEGAWAVNTIISDAPEDIVTNTGLAVLPAIEGGKGNPNSTSAVTGIGPAISSKLEAKKKEAAEELIYALFGPEGQTMTANNNVPVSYKVDLSESDVHPLYKDLTDLISTLETTPVYDAVLTSEGTEAVNNGLQELLLGADPKEVAKKIQAAQVK